MRFPAVAILTLSALTASTPASAQDASQLAARRLLLEQAQAAALANDHANALALAQRAAAIQSTPSVRMFVAQEQAALSRWTEVLATASLCANEADANPMLTNRDAILGRCHELLAAARAHVGVLMVHVARELPAGTEVSVGGSVLPPALYDAAYPVEVGGVTVEAHAGQSVVFHREVTITAGATVSIDVAPEASTTTAPARTVVRADEPAAGGGVPGGVIALGVAAVAGFGAAAAFGVLRQNALGNCTVYSDHVGCPSDQDTERARAAEGWTYATDAALAVGGVALVGGVVFWLLAPRDRGDRAGRVPARAWSPGVVPIVGGAAIQVRGAF